MKPDISYSRNNVDFGQGFYTTPLLQQAEEWGKKFKDKKKSTVISIYNFDEKVLNQCKVLDFKSYSEEWLDFILNCRAEETHLIMIS